MKIQRKFTNYRKKINQSTQMYIDWCCRQTVSILTIADTEFKQVVSLVWACSTVLPVQTIVASSAYLTSKASIILESRSLM